MRTPGAPRMMLAMGRTLHDHHRHGAVAGVMHNPRALEVTAAIGFLGARREVYTRLAGLLRPRPGERFLDVGCGTGYLMRILSPVAGPKGQVVGVDPSPEMIAHARRRAQANCEFEVAEAHKLPFPDASFDGVVSSLAVHHVPEESRQTALREMFRVLKPGGRVVIAELRPPANPLLRGLVSLVAAPAVQGDPYDMFRTLVPEAGFEIEAVGDLPVMLSYVRGRKPA